jgi:hypothetical protein
MEEKKLKFKSGVQCKVDVNIVNDEFVRIKKEKGSLTSRNLLDESTPEDAPVHPYFEWDNNKAADKHRLQQSRDLINGVLVIEVKEDNKTESKSEWVGINVEDMPKNEKQYFSRDELSIESDLKDKYLSELRTKIENIIAKYMSFDPNDEQIKLLKDLFKDT